MAPNNHIRPPAKQNNGLVQIPRPGLRIEHLRAPQRNNIMHAVRHRLRDAEGPETREMEVDLRRCLRARNNSEHDPRPVNDMLFACLMDQNTRLDETRCADARTHPGPVPIYPVGLRGSASPYMVIKAPHRLIASPARILSLRIASMNPSGAIIGTSVSGSITPPAPANYPLQPSTPQGPLLLRRDRSVGYSFTNPPTNFGSKTAPSLTDRRDYDAASRGFIAFLDQGIITHCADLNLTVWNASAWDIMKDTECPPTAHPISGDRATWIRNMDCTKSAPGSTRCAATVCRI
ncbi:uncharacterized protein DSM5745_07618 [Aspergillus mulundensis]|uniref:Uncharacterized protein n=1 Tax=Aspergillus mulundensis TaxID=1810919 RepID=A0A3D8RES5_9EURO|nr:hypothetical protein DSM5745_07618 [Aspergillus mulundensis]RDW72446.1 hypothetical protein DSM5745_07618 [Aspergillus mulundensis]